MSWGNEEVPDSQNHHLEWADEPKINFLSLLISLFPILLVLQQEFDIGMMLLDWIKERIAKF